jgi:hypothetical protein
MRKGYSANEHTDRSSDDDAVSRYRRRGRPGGRIRQAAEAIAVPERSVQKSQGGGKGARNLAIVVAVAGGRGLVF